MVDEGIGKRTELKKTLSYPVILLITVNAILGTGIYFLPAVGAKTSGPASLIAWAILGVFAIYTSMCFGELSSMFPKAGGVYEFARQGYGRFISFMVGWTALIAGNLTIAMLVVGAIQYLIGQQGAPLVNILLAVFLIVLFNLTAYRGMKLSSMLLVAFAIITMGTLTALIVPGIFSISLSNFSPFFVFPASAILVTMFLIVETFFGWETATFLAAETKDGHKVLPKALVTGTVVIAVLSLVFVFTSLGVIPWQQFGGSLKPLSDLGMALYGGAGGEVFTLLVYMAILGSVAGWIVAAPRLILAMAEDQLFFKQLAAIHPKYHTPHKAIIFQMILTIILVFAGSHIYTTLLKLLVPLVLILYSAVVLVVPVLRFRKPNLKRYYWTPLGKVGPIILAGFNIMLVLSWLVGVEESSHILKLAFSFVLFGFPCYFLIALYHDPKMITSVKDITAHLTRFAEPFIIPKRIRKEVFNLLGNIGGKTVLEYGCSIGTMTLPLAKAVGPSGRVFALDFSTNELKITQRRVDRAYWLSEEIVHGKVHVLHDQQLVHRVHPSVPYADVTVSVGMLSYVQDIKKVLKEINVLMPNRGKVCFVEFVDFFKVIPNVAWLGKNEVIERIFRNAGFSVQVIRKKGLFWNYVFVYGIKSRKDIAFI